MSDLKADNLMVKVAADGSFQDCTVLDVGGSAAFSGASSPSGPCMYAPVCMAHSTVPLVFRCVCTCVACMRH